MTDDFFEVRQEAHVQQAVGFVDYKNVQPVEEQHFLIEQIQQPSGGGDQNVDAFVECIHLLFLADASEDHRLSDLCAGSVDREAVMNLQREFSGGGDGESERAFGDRFEIPACEMIEDRQREGGRFAGARLSAAQDVSTVQRSGNGGRLYGGGFGVALVRERFLQRRNQVEI